MGTRTIHVCDWCKAETPSVRNHYGMGTPDSWEYLDREDVLLCNKCSDDRRMVLRRVEEIRKSGTPWCSTCGKNHEPMVIVVDVVCPPPPEEGKHDEGTTL